MIILGYICAILIGIFLGLVGGGGSIFTVPVLIYLFDMSAYNATTHSLFVVGITALVGVFKFIYRNMVDLKIIVHFAIPALIAVFISRTYLVPAIPEIISVGDWSITKSMVITLLFSAVMLSAAYYMIKEEKLNRKENKFNYWLFILRAFFVGLITGIIGIGGGFLIVPSLILLANIDMKKAIGTSLGIIAINSLGGFVSDIFHRERIIEWLFLCKISLLAIIGIWIGSYFLKFISAFFIKKIFGYFVFITSICIIIYEIFFR